MARKIIIPPYERMIMEIAIMGAEELELLIRCAKVALNQQRPKAPRKKAVEERKTEKAS